jgi:hypothetical protein
MAATSLSKTMQSLLKDLRKDYPSIHFVKGTSFYWSPETQSVSYASSTKEPEVAAWSLLHEVSHASLGHNTYFSDFELVQLEVAAWAKARDISKKYNIEIDPDHVEDCLDTYRDWLHRRSACPTCSMVSVQKNPDTYACFNCGQEWHVSNSRFCRPYRKRLIATK